MDGIPGEKGDDVTIPIEYLRGDTGYPGITGMKGLPGEPGTKGDVGLSSAYEINLQGEKGVKGEQGAPGEKFTKRLLLVQRKNQRYQTELLQYKMWRMYQRNVCVQFLKLNQLLF